jgi:hypothetical protein
MLNSHTLNPYPTDWLSKASAAGSGPIPGTDSRHFLGFPDEATWATVSPRQRISAVGGRDGVRDFFGRQRIETPAAVVTGRVRLVSRLCVPFVRELLSAVDWFWRSHDIPRRQRVLTSAAMRPADT